MTEKMIYVVILTWNNYKDTVECIESLLKIELPKFSLLLVDNASTDDTFKKVIKRFPDIEKLSLDQNLGVSGGYNAGLKYALQKNAENIILSNNDIVFGKNSLEELINTINSKENVGIVVPKTFNYFQPKKLAGLGGRWRKFPPSVKMIGVNVPDSTKFQNLTELEYAISSCYLVTRELIEDIGFYDTNFFFYNDDWDFSIRTRKAGFKILLQPDAHIWHKVSISTQKSKKKAIWWNYFGRSTVRFYKKHRNTLELNTYILWFILREIIKLNLNRIPPFLKGVSYEMKQYNC